MKKCYGADLGRDPSSQGRNGLVHFLLNSTTAFSLAQMLYYIGLLSVILHGKGVSGKFVMLEISHQKKKKQPPPKKNNEEIRPGVSGLSNGYTTRRFIHAHMGR